MDKFPIHPEVTEESKLTRLNVTELSVRLNEMCRERCISIPGRDDGVVCEPSSDTGTFLCNYLYYHSVCKTEGNADGFSLFLHVPNQMTCPLEIQYAFLRVLMEALQTV